MSSPPVLDDMLEGLLAARTRWGSSEAIRDILAAAAAPEVLSMAGGLPAPDSFPVDELSTGLDEVMRTAPQQALQYGPVEGVPAMREVIAARATDTGAAASPSQILITSGSQQGLELTARVLLDPGDVVALDDPSYLGAVQTFRQAGARLMPIPSDDDGMDVESLAEQLACGNKPKLVYVVPHFHNPTGAVLASPRRKRLADLAERYGFLIVEDDPYADLAFDGIRLPSTDVFTDRVVRLMSLSKTLCPGLRVAGLVAPSSLTAALAAAKQCADLQTNTFGQHVIARLLNRSDFLTGHVEKLRELYRARAACLAEILAAKSKWLTFQPPRGGLFFWCALAASENVDTTRLSRAALEEGVAVVPGAPFCVRRDGTRQLRLSYATLQPEQMREGVERLSRAYERLQQGRPS